ncbi:uncharacterized protein LOC144704520 [Wolffia australiana]
MGINKFLAQRIIPGCLYVVDPPSESKPRKPTTIKLITMDGRVEVFHRPVPASELMAKHPTHLICRSDSFTIGHKIPSLKETELLLPGNSYFLLPLHLFQSVLSFVVLASYFSSFKKSSPIKHPTFEIHKTTSGKLQVRVSEEFIRKMEELQSGVRGGWRLCTTDALLKEYRQLVVDCKEMKWKPKMEPIKEKERKRDVRTQRKMDRRERKKEEKKLKSTTKKLKKVKKKEVVVAEGRNLSAVHAHTPKDWRGKKKIVE